MKSFSIIIPTYGRMDLLTKCIASIRKHEPNTEKYEIIVVDDFSTQAHRDEIQKFVKDTDIRLVLTEKNVGFSSAVNAGLISAQGAQLVLCNNDVEFNSTILEKFAETHQKHKASIVGCHLLYPSGETQHGGVEFAAGNFCHTNAPEQALKDRYCIAVTFALVSITRRFLEDQGGLDEEYFMACEDTEYCLRAWRNKHQVFYAHAIQAIHHEGATRGRTTQDKLTLNLKCLVEEGKSRIRLSERLHDVDQLLAKVKRSNRELTGPIKAELTDEPLEPESISELTYRYKLPSSLREKAYRALEVGGKLSIEFDFFDLENTLRKHHFEKVNVEKTVLIEAYKKAQPIRTRIKRMGAMGDVILTTPLIRALHAQGEQVHVTTDCPDVFRNNPIVASVNTNIPCDRLLDLDLCYERDPKKHIMDAYADFANCPESKALKPELWRDVHPFPDAVDYIVIHPAMSWENRTWPNNYWEDLTVQLKKSGFNVIAVGSGGDQHVKSAFNVRGFTIHQIAALLAGAQAFIGSDSGILHVAATTDVPIVGIFTCAKGEFRLPKRKNATAVIPKLDCYGCLHETKPPVVFVGCKFGTNACVTDVTPTQVYGAAIQVLKLQGEFVGRLLG